MNNLDSITGMGKDFLLSTLSKLGLGFIVVFNGYRRSFPEDKAAGARN